MKKYFYLMALAIVPMFFTSCGDDEADGPSQVVMSQPTYYQDAALYNISDNTPVPLDGQSVRLHSIELTESGKYLIAYEPVTLSAPTRSIATVLYYLGNFHKDGATIVLDGFGNIKINAGNGSNVSMTLNLGGNDIEISAQKAATMNASILTDNLCRTWKIKTYRIRTTVDGITLSSQNFEAPCDLNKLIQVAEDRGIHITNDLGNKNVIDGIFFSRAGTFQINYQSTSAKDVGKWNWTSQDEANNTGKIGYKWNDDGMGNSFLAGEAKAVFKNNTTCELSLKAKIDNSNDEVEAVFVMTY